MQYKVRFTTPHDPYNIQRETLDAKSESEVRAIYSDVNLIDVEPVEAPVTVAAMIARRDALIDELKDGNPTREAARAMCGELMEIVAWLDENDAADDQAEWKLRQRTGEKL